jgi:AraC-like DNA-binding protein
MRLRSLAVDKVTVTSTLLSTGSVRSRVHDNYTLCLPTQGTMRMTAGTASSVLAGGGTGFVICPASGGTVLEQLSEEIGVLWVSFERLALEAELGAMVGRPVSSRVRFAPLLDLSSHDALYHTLGLLQAALAGPDDVVDDPVVARGLARLALHGLLRTQPHPWREELRRASHFTAPRAIRAALVAIEEDPGRYVTVSDIALGAGLSVRALEAGFRRYVHASPMAYLNRVRLSRAHEALEQADPETTTATAVAQRWGFGNYGRFASRYRQRYGCSPADTLRGSDAREDRPGAGAAGQPAAR